MFQITINERVKELRKEMKLSQEQFGFAIGLTKSGISNIENGTRNVTEKHIKLICAEFNVKEQWLRTGEEPVFDNEDEFLIDQISKKHKLSEQDEEMLQNFFKLSPEQRYAINHYVKITMLSSQLEEKEKE